MSNQDTLELLMKKMGEKLKHLRQEKGYTSHESFAYDYDLPRAQYWKIESGKANLTFRSLLRLLEIHEMTIEEFFKSLKN